jgi:Domain of unknown function (DUF1707)
MSRDTTKLVHRVGDEERHKVAEILSDHHAHGRLSKEEFEERLGAALTAQTTAELGRLLADLPLRHDVERSAPSRRQTTRTLARLSRKAAPTAVALGGLAALSAAADVAAPHSSHYVFVFTFGTGVFGLIAGRVTGLFARRRPADDADRD